MIKNLIKKLIPKKLLPKAKAVNFMLRNKVTYAQDCLYTTVNADFMQDQRFANAYAKGRGLMLDSWGDYQFHWRAYVVCWAAQQAKNLAGDFVECGVNTGMLDRMIIDYVDFEKLPKKFYLMDTFQGMDEAYSTEAEMKRSDTMGYVDVYEQVKNTFKNFPNVELVKGPIPDTLSLVPSNAIAYLSIDMNCVAPEIAALEYFWDKVVPGGIIVFDDYGFPGHEQQKHAHDAFAVKKGIAILALPTGQGIIIKS